MEYKFNWNGKDYDLPKKSLSISKMIDDCYKANNGPSETSYRKQYDTVSTIIGKENLDECLGTTSINDCDVNEVTMIFLEIEDAYNAEFDAYRERRNQAALNSPSIQKAIKLGDSVGKIASLPDKR